MEWRVDRNGGIPNLWQGSSRENRLSWPTEAAGKGGVRGGKGDGGRGRTAFNVEVGQL